MNIRLILVGILGIFIIGGGGFALYSFLTLEDDEFTPETLKSTEETVTESLQGYHQHGWDGFKPFLNKTFVKQFGALEVEKSMNVVFKPNLKTDTFEFVMDEFSPPRTEEKVTITELTGIVTRNKFPTSRARFQLAQSGRSWEITGFSVESFQNTQPIDNLEMPEVKRTAYEFFDLAHKSSGAAYRSTHPIYQKMTQISEFEKLLSLLKLPYQSAPECRSYFKTKDPNLPEVDAIYVFQFCKTPSSYDLEINLLRSGDTVSIGGLFLK